MDEKLRTLYRKAPDLALVESLAPLATFWLLLLETARKDTRPWEQKRQLLAQWKIVVHRVVDSTINAAELIQSLDEQKKSSRRRRKGNG